MQEMRFTKRGMQTYITVKEYGEITAMTQDINIGKKVRLITLNFFKFTPSIGSLACWSLSRSQPTRIENHVVPTPKVRNKKSWSI